MFSERKKYLLLFIIFLSLNINSNIYAGGVVYLVLGSDTAIWDGMGTATFNNYYNIDLYTNPSRNAYSVMNPAFRAPLTDSYGTPLKMTWWMMAGNIFRYATNKNMPVPNIMTLYLMKKYHGDNVINNGDELSLHYHTFFWSDYDSDGVYFWNQSKTFLESLDDFNVTLAQFLLEEETFPVSFRSGWHYMDNDWQHYLDQKILPYGMHNDYPSKRIVDDEPIDNIYDWSKTPAAWKPYRPSYADYQIPGKGKGWNVRSISFQRALYDNSVESMFAEASTGENQIACLWAHLPENDFLENIIAVDKLLHEMEVKYPGVTFKYCTAIEAMQLWRESTDYKEPEITITEISNGDKVYFEISSDEAIFQDQPVVAIKDINSNYNVEQCARIGENLWKTKESFYKKDLAKVGVTVCDTLGNQSMEFIEYLPADMFLDNLDNNYSETSGSWTTTKTNAWGTDSRVTQVSESDSAIAHWTFDIQKSTYYNLFTQVADIDNAVENFQYTVFVNSVAIDTIRFNKKLNPFSWVYLKTLLCDENDEVKVEYKALGKNNPSKNAIADVLKISALVKDKDLNVEETIIPLNEIVVGDTTTYDIVISNYGTQPLKIFGIISQNKSLISEYSYPLEISSMSSVKLTLDFNINIMGEFKDTLLILSDDLSQSKFTIPIHANVFNYFSLVDNEDATSYSEFGDWKTSVATSHGTSSRYAYLNSTPKSHAEFNVTLEKEGLYKIYEILPKTVNASNRALYTVSIDKIIIDSIYIDQNIGSGVWKLIGSYYFPSEKEITVKIADTGESTEGVVLRADAFKFQSEEATTSKKDVDLADINYRLDQNYPNPFNPSTTISYYIPESGNVKLEIFNMLGEKVFTLVNEALSAGPYSAVWRGINNNGAMVSSGIYFYRISTQSFYDTKKMIFLR